MTNDQYAVGDKAEEGRKFYYLRAVNPEIPKECRLCALLKPMRETLPPGEHLLPGEEYRYRCSVGRLDHKMPDGSTVPNSWPLSTIVKPGKEVAAAQKDCPSFVVNPNLANIYPRLAKKYGVAP